MLSRHKLKRHHFGSKRFLITKKALVMLKLQLTFRPGSLKVSSGHLFASLQHIADSSTSGKLTLSIKSVLNSAPGSPQLENLMFAGHAGYGRAGQGCQAFHLLERLHCRKIDV